MGGDEEIMEVLIELPMNENSLPSPSQLLGAGHFDSWYPGQYSLLEQSLSWYASPARFLGIAAPTGTGKTLSSLLLSKLSEARTVILTATKGLQSQYMVDAAQLGGVVIQGQNNYPCILVKGLSVDAGPCHDGFPCPIKSRCPYYVQLRKAMDSKLVITNYAYWLAQTNFSQGLGDVGLLVLDEAHSAFSAMENYLTIFLSRMDIQSIGLSFPESPDQWGVWQSWATASSPVAAEQVASIEEELKQHRSLGQQAPGSVSRAFRNAKSSAAKLERLSTINEQWVIQQTYHGYRFVPKWVANYSSHLFKSVPKIVLMSAILSHRSLDYLGVPSGEERSWVEMESQFPVKNAPIWHIPTARINQHTDDFGSTIWVSRIDQLIQRRLDRKGIVFTVSYERARLLLSRSRFKDIMLTHSTGDVVQVVEKFKRMPSPAILLSPTVTTGWDFPMLTSGQGKPQYGIIGKIPYPDTSDVVTHARHKDDKEWTAYLAMETFIQSVGRLNRTPDDLSEFFVVDDSWIWWWPAYRKFATKGLVARIKGSLESVPEALV